MSEELYYNRLISALQSSCMSNHNSGTDRFVTNIDWKTLKNHGMFASSFPCKSQLSQLRIVKPSQEYSVALPNSLISIGGEAVQRSRDPGVKLSLIHI